MHGVCTWTMGTSFGVTTSSPPRARARGWTTNPLRTSRVFPGVTSNSVETLVEIPPTAFPSNQSSSMRHCVFTENDAGVTTYCFTENRPANAGTPAFEAAGIYAYVGRVAAQVETHGETLNEPEYATPNPPEPVTTTQIPVTLPEEAPEETPPAKRNVVSSPGAGVGGDASGKSGAAVFERGVGIAAWQGLEIGHKVDVVLEVPGGFRSVAAEVRVVTVPAAPTPAAREKKIWFAQPLMSAPRAGRQTRSGAAIFRDGAGFVTFRDAVFDIGLVAQTPFSAPALERKTVALRDARCASTGGVAFSGAGFGAASWRRPAEPRLADAPSSAGDAALKPSTDFATVAVWVACGVLFAFKVLINPA